MIVASTTDKVLFVPPWREAEPSPPRFYLRAAGVIERAQMEAELSGTLRAGRVYGFELRAAIVSGVQTLLRDDRELDAILALIATEQEDAASLTDDDRRVLVQTRAIMEEHWPEYRDLLAQMARRNELAPIVALRRFCVGWENVTSNRGQSIEFSLGFDGMVTEKALSAVPELEMMAAGNRAFALQYLDEEAEGNSQPPQPSGGDQQTSLSDGSSKADGKSKAAVTKKTRA
ncbi:MAG TPA: hypothetical protein DEP91_04375 [Sphingomonas bacterium]|jgi:hypothetical protein|uniref:Uncharacterized protein n=1 Tax=Sphingomonas bacterium TaxID=1895847 RepID=A0A3D0WBP1_9SPHN|nr:hypothetical protein [Sphingomonas bacterium]